ncbi:MULTISPECIES: GNAT family N-acetyltransferase [unclassified Saccharothrix]|uniref:GNAT family N-acetyltransferase n=1 Tax=unclassified Saccharothrix TaxID=2593673 RepID=UPI00307E4117
MSSSAEPVEPVKPFVREARPDDVVAICRFGEAHIRPHYAPLIGVAAADEQVRRWWNETHVDAAVAEGLVVVAEPDAETDAETDGHVVGVGQRGRRGADHVVYKLYVHPRHRGHGLGLRLLDALIKQLPADTDRLYVEHFAANERAGAFYEREGFTVERIEPSPTGNPALGVVWRARPLAASAETPEHA